MSSHQPLIKSLAAQVTPSKPLMNNDLLALLWLLGSVIYCLVIIHLLGPIRSNAYQQLLTEPRFMLEMLVGLTAIVLTSLVAFRHTVPGALSRPLKMAANIAVLFWIAMNVYGLVDPAMEPSTAGYRHYCVYETFIYALPPLLIAGLLAWRRLAFELTNTGFGLGLAAGMIPAWYMQIACMYAPEHMLKFHLLPAIAVAGLGALLLNYKGLLRFLKR
ncbi:MAG: DUF1109 family protein [Gammaproteobacteria bacterium]|nr:DUF1109 family protein [Gammaproteobacteria bacterium]MBQ0838147.1 DUF1109 family protein [Gammaproteobacteria bacterium]